MIWCVLAKPSRLSVSHVAIKPEHGKRHHRPIYPPTVATIYYYREVGRRTRSKAILRKSNSNAEVEEGFWIPSKFDWLFHYFHDARVCNSLRSNSRLLNHVEEYSITIDGSMQDRSFKRSPAFQG